MRMSGRSGCCGARVRGGIVLFAALAMVASGCLGGDLDLEAPVTETDGSSEVSDGLSGVTDDGEDVTDGTGTEDATGSPGSTGTLPDCEVDDDCVMESGCLRGVCVDGMCSGETPAEDGEACGTGRLCVGGACQQMASCASDADCPGETACREAASCDVSAGYCALQTPRADGTACGESGEECVSGLCGVPCDGAGDCGEAGPCEEGGGCNEVTGLCRPVQPRVDGEECGDGGVCSSGRCIPPGGCEENSDCAEEELEPCQLPPLCDDATNVCLEPASATDGTPCGTAAGQCQGGVCVEECEDDDGCPGETQCRERSSCVGLQCTVPVPREDGTECTPAGAGGDPGDDAGLGMCLSGSCVLVSCVSDEDCLTDSCMEGATCEEGSCTAGEPRQCGDGSPCQTWTCLSDRPREEACVLLAEQEVQVWFQDCDGDGFAPLGAERIETCFPPEQGPSACPNGSWTQREPTSAVFDCNDFDANARPNQTRYFTDPIRDGPTAGMFDYDCDGVESRAWTTTVGVSSVCLDRDCDTADPGGWEGTRVPACGENSTWVQCRRGSAGVCLRNVEPRTQACR